MSWDDHDRERAMPPQRPTAAPDKHDAACDTLAATLRGMAGVAFAAGDDQRATVLRKLATDAESLKVLVTRPR